MFGTSDGPKNAYENDIRLVYELCPIGKGQASGETLYVVMNLPKPRSKFQMYNLTVKNAVKQLAMNTFYHALKEAVECIEVPVHLTVARDGT
jgi:hypothetical protein